MQIFEDYLQRLKTMFDGEAFQADFAKNSPAVTQEINKWISEKTSGNINRFFKDNLDEYTKLVLISIITFKFNWKDQFLTCTYIFLEYYKGVFKVRIQRK